MVKSAMQSMVYSSIWITLCAMAMFENTCLWILGVMRFKQLNIYIISATLFLYSLHRLLSQQRIKEPLAEYKQWFNKYRIFVIAICIVSGIVAFIDFFFLPRYEQISFVIFGAFSMLYEVPALIIGKRKYRLRDLGLLKMVAIVLVWMGSTVWMPINKFVPIHQIWLYTPFILSQTCFFTILCLSFDERDSQYDVEQGIYTWATRLGPKRLLVTYAILLFLYVQLSVWAIKIMPHAHPTLLIGVVATAIITYSLVTRPAKNSMFHYVFIDGLMVFQAFLSWVIMAAHI